MAKVKKNTNNIGLAGEFAVLSALNLHRWNASLTLGNTKSVDIIAYRDDNPKTVKIEVKTSSSSGKFTNSKIFGKTISWRMDQKHEKLLNEDLFYCFVRWNKDVKKSFDPKESVFPVFYIVPSKVVAKYIKTEHELWRKEKKKKSNFTLKMRNFRLGDESGKYKIETHKAEKYENAWNILLNK
jgi:hypothetical protein